MFISNYAANAPGNGPGAYKKKAMLEINEDEIHKANDRNKKAKRKRVKVKNPVFSQKKDSPKKDNKDDELPTKRNG